MTTIETRAVVNTGKGKMDTDLKKSRWGNPEILLQDHAVVDNGCSSHMTMAIKLIFQTIKISMEALWLLEVIPKEVKSKLLI
ncbi:hypothetical protein Tco_0380223 [Tanacetum coccineum]